MREVADVYRAPDELLLGKSMQKQVPAVDQKRQRHEVLEILQRLRTQPGVILADEVGMGKTYVALGVAYSVAIHSQVGPVVVMVPANLIDKWVQDLGNFFDLYVKERRPVDRDGPGVTRAELLPTTSFRYGVARHSVELLKLLDDPVRERCHLVFLAHGAMARRQSDKWIRLALIADALRRHGRGKSRLVQVKEQIHRYMGQLLWAIGDERTHDDGEALWRRLLRTDPAAWKGIYNETVREGREFVDDPVPKAVRRALGRLDLKSLASALETMPVRARGGEDRLAERIGQARNALREVERTLWTEVLVRARWRSPLLVMDEAHHLKNPATHLARQLQSAESHDDLRALRTGEGAMAESFARMLFLTATPFQLGHGELVNVLRRFGDVLWDPDAFGAPAAFHARLDGLRSRLDDSQRTAIALQRAWKLLRPEDCDPDVDGWWHRVCKADPDSLNYHTRCVVEAFREARARRGLAEEELRPWIVRENKGSHWPGTTIARRQRLVGAAIADQAGATGLPVPPEQMLPFFLAARSAVRPGQDLLGEALSSSYEAFRKTREENRAVRDDSEQEETNERLEVVQARWYLGEFDQALEACSGAAHPKISATVRKAVELWQSGEKVLVFGFYRHTCRALRIHISREIERRIHEAGRQRLGLERSDAHSKDIDRLVARIQKRYFDDTDAPGRKALQRELVRVVHRQNAALKRANVTQAHRHTLIGVMRRFLRVPSTLVRCFPLAELDIVEPSSAVKSMLEHEDGSGLSWRAKFDHFVQFLTECSPTERELYLEAAQRTQTGGIRVEAEARDEDDVPEDRDEEGRVLLANVQMATGATRREARTRLMRAFNTPFFPDVLVCSEVMGEGVDLQRFCRHVIHHDLAWNPSTIEQRTGRIDRIGCKAQGQQPILVYLPFLSGTADERQYQVMSDRERWFRIVMGQDEVAKLITADSTSAVSLPQSVSDELGFKLGLE